MRLGGSAAKDADTAAPNHVLPHQCFGAPQNGIGKIVKQISKRKTATSGDDLTVVSVAKTLLQHLKKTASKELATVEKGNQVLLKLEAALLLPDPASDDSSTWSLAERSKRARHLARRIYAQAFGAQASAGSVSGQAKRGGGEIVGGGRALRSLLFNLKDTNNHSLRRRILHGELPVEKLLTLDSDELANEELARKRKRKREEKHEEWQRNLKLQRAGDKPVEGIYTCELCNHKTVFIDKTINGTIDGQQTEHIIAVCAACEYRWRPDG